MKAKPLTKKEKEMLNFIYEIRKLIFDKEKRTELLYKIDTFLTTRK